MDGVASWDGDGKLTWNVGDMCGPDSRMEYRMMMKSKDGAVGLAMADDTDCHCPDTARK